LSWFRHFHEDETASGATEFLILVPVYLLFMIGLFSMGNLMIVRQALVSVTRNTAWDDTKTSDVNANIPGPYRGSLAIKVKAADGFAFNGTEVSPGVWEGGGGEIDPSMINGSGGFAGRIAMKALNNEPLRESPFTIRTTHGTYTYDGLNFGPSLVQGTRAAVLLPKKHKRKVYKVSGGKDHVAADWSSRDYYDPSVASSGNSLPINPQYKGFFGKPEGVWRNGERVNGRVEDEHSFFKSRVTK
jgi:TadE-like protein